MATFTEHYCQSSNKTNIFYKALLTQQPHAVLIAIHGWSVHSEQHTKLFASLENKNMALFALDLRGHGKSSGQRGHINKWSNYLDDVYSIYKIASTKYPTTPIFIFGHSMGGLIAARFVQEYRNEQYLTGVILSAAMFKLALQVSKIKTTLGKIMSSIIPCLSLSQKLDPKTLTKDENGQVTFKEDPLVHNRVSARWYTESLKAMDIAINQANIIMCKTLTLHGDADTVNSIEGSKMFHTNLQNKDKQLNIYPGYYHNLCEEVGGDKVILDICEWLSKHIQK